jgi:hypothetical protein
MKKEEVLGKMNEIDVGRGDVREVKSVKELGALLEGNGELYEWWRVHMGFKKDEEAP